MVYSMLINSSACISFSFAKIFSGKLIASLIYLISIGLAPAYVHSSECIGIVTAGGGQDFWGEVQTGAHKAAEELGMKSLAPKTIQLKVEEILGEREYYSAFEAKLITKDEIVELIIGHLYTLIYSINDADYSNSQVVSNSLKLEFRSALFTKV